MARVTIEDCLRRVQNRFLLVHAVTRRVRRMRQNAQYLGGSPTNLRTNRRNEGVPVSRQGREEIFQEIYQSR